MSIDHYPSTYDCPAEEGGDPVLVCMENARERLVRGHLRGTYICRGDCCAVGALALVDGHERWKGAAKIDQWLSATAREAMSLLNVVALERHPEAGDRERWIDTWTGELEWVNEQWLPGSLHFGEDRWRSTVKTEVLTIYDIAIKRRRAEAESLVVTKEEELVLA